LSRVFADLPREGYDFVSKFLRYNPSSRFTASVLAIIIHVEL
jgi:hypothetical protein